MKMKHKLLIFDLDGTLFDTKEVNFNAYSKAIQEAGCKAIIDYQFYCDFCNGNSYKVFLPQIVPDLDQKKMGEIHDRKKSVYSSFLNYARINHSLIALIQACKTEYSVCIVTTASRKNTEDILRRFDVISLFDFIITQEDVDHPKPSPEGFLLAMQRADVKQEDTLIFEDSEVGVEAAKQSGAKYVRVYGFN